MPPPPAHPLIIRSISYGSEKHYAALKRTIVVPISRLPLKNAAAFHKFKLLAGARWSVEPSKDSGLGREEANGEHGYFKISCEDFPHASMNLKWASDALDRLIATANVSTLTLLIHPFAKYYTELQRHICGHPIGHSAPGGQDSQGTKRRSCTGARKYSTVNQRLPEGMAACTPY